MLGLLVDCFLQVLLLLLELLSSLLAAALSVDHRRIIDVIDTFISLVS
jgi:hypothetical protein